MAETISNLGDVTQDQVQQGLNDGSLVDNGDGIFLSGVIGESITGTSDVTDLDGSTLGNTELTLVLTGNQDLNASGANADDRLVGNDGDNVLSGNGGDDQYSTGAGTDTINFGTGSNTVEVDGGGEKTIVGNLDGGNNLIIIQPAENSDDASTTLLTKLKIGDKVRVQGIQDADGDGKLTVADIEGISSDADGNAVFTLKDGSSFTLSGVNADSAVNGEIAYDIVDNGNGSFDVVLKAADDMS